MSVEHSESREAEGESLLHSAGELTRSTESELAQSNLSEISRSIDLRLRERVELLADTLRKFQSGEVKVDLTLASALIDRLYDAGVEREAWMLTRQDQSTKELMNGYENLRYQASEWLHNQFGIEPIYPMPEVSKFDLSRDEDPAGGRPLTTTNADRDNLILQTLRPGVLVNGQVITKAIVKRAVYQPGQDTLRGEDVLEVPVDDSLF